MNFPHVAHVGTLVQHLTIAQNIIIILKYLIMFVCPRKHHLKVFKFGKFLVKDITRESFLMKHFLIKLLNFSINFFRIIAKGAGGGLGSGGVSSSRGAIVSSVIELHKDEEIYILVGQSGEHACIKSMGLQDESCSTEKTKHSELPKTHLVKDVHNYSMH